MKKLDLTKEELKEYKKHYMSEWRQRNKECITQYNREYLLNNRETINIRKSKWYKENRDTQNEYYRTKRRDDTLFRIASLIRSNIHIALSKRNHRKTCKTVQILGCSFIEFKSHIESKFESWMTWDNQGKYNGQFNYGWDLDHIIPISTGRTEEEILKSNHYSNLQPLCTKVNRFIKSNKINYANE